MPNNSYTDNTNGMTLPPYTAFVVIQGTLDAPEKVAYFSGEYFSVDGEKDVTLNSFQDFVDNNFTHIATLHVDSVNHTSTLVYVNPSKGSPSLRFRRSVDEL